MGLEDIARKGRTLPDVLERAVADGRTTRDAADEILAAWREAETVLGDAARRDAARRAARHHTAAGLRAALAEDVRAQVRPAFAPLRTRIAGALRAHAEFEARAPFLVRLPDGTHRDVRSVRPVSAEAELLRELRDRRAVDHLLALGPAERGARLRAIAEAGDDRDRPLLDAALRAPDYLGLVDARTREAATEAHLRRHGLDVALRQGAFRARALADLGAEIDRALAEIEPPAGPAPRRVRADGTLAPAE